MKTTFKSFVLGLLVAFTATSAFGQDAMLTFTGGGNNATFDGTARMLDPALADDMAAINGDALLTGAGTFDLTVTTTSDVLLFDAEFTQTAGVNVPGGWYNQTANPSDTGPQEGFFGFVPALRFDTWVTTPGMTAAAGSNTLDGPAGMNKVTHNDSTDEGPQTDFVFARVSLIPDAEGNASATLSGTLQTSATPTPVFDTFEYTMTIGVPEPSSMGLLLTALLGGLTLIRRKRRS